MTIALDQPQAVPPYSQVPDLKRKNDINNVIMFSYKQKFLNEKRFVSWNTYPELEWDNLAAVGQDIVHSHKAVEAFHNLPVAGSYLGQDTPSLILCVSQFRSATAFRLERMRIPIHPPTSFPLVIFPLKICSNYLKEITTYAFKALLQRFKHKIMLHKILLNVFKLFCCIFFHTRVSSSAKTVLLIVAIEIFFHCCLIVLLLRVTWMNENFSKPPFLS